MKTQQEQVKDRIEELQSKYQVKIELWGSFEKGYFVWTDIKVPHPEKDDGYFLVIDSRNKDLDTLRDVLMFLNYRFEQDIIDLTSMNK